MTMTPTTIGGPRWLHAWAIINILATLPLLFLGAEVTTLDAGMSDPVGFRWPNELLRLFFDATGLGLQFEYSHRLAGMIVGCLAIGLAVALWLKEPRRWVRWMGVLALTLICVQGLIGKYRVDLNALIGRPTALVHGCFAQIVFAVLVSLALFTSRTWLSDVSTSTPMLRRWAWLTAALIYVQLFFGGIVRHLQTPLGPRAHLLGAMFVVAAVVWLARLTYETPGAPRRPLVTLVALVGLQIYLGIETWLSRFYVPSADLPQLRPVPGHDDYFRTTHYLVGTMIFAASIVLALRISRRVVSVPVVDVAPAYVAPLEGAV